MTDPQLGDATPEADAASKAERERELHEATPESETARVDAVAKAHDLALDDPAELDLSGAPGLIAPGARLFAALVRELGPVGGQLLAVLQDSRYDALKGAMRDVVELLATGPKLADELRGAFNPDRIELAAIRAVEDFGLPVLAEIRRAERKARLAAGPTSKAEAEALAIVRNHGKRRGR